MQEAFCTETLQAYIGQGPSAPACRVFQVLDSTNNEARRMSADGFSGTAILVAAEQTAGRGRMGRRFYSPTATGAYFSILYTPKVPLCDAVRVTSAASVSVMRAIRVVSGRQTQIKWVNDLYLDGKKVCGILTEAVTGESGTQIIVGIGINLSTEHFPAELAGIAGSVGADSVSPLAMVTAVWRELEPYLQNPEDASWLEDYRAHSCVIGRAITWRRGDEVIEGQALAIDESGALLVRREGGAEERLHTGEISLRLQ